MAGAKDCPRCGLTNPPDALICDCGWNFVTSSPGPPVGEPEAVPGFAGNHQLIPRARQQLGGLLLALVGAGSIIWMWHTALREGGFQWKASISCPAFLVLGLALIVLPGYKEERIARGEDISRLSGFELITPRWWGVFTLAIVAGMVNWALLAWL